MARVFTITEGLENLGALKTGGQGSVYKGKRMGEIITAVKLLPTPIDKEDPQNKHYRDFQNEVQKLQKVNEAPNPNVVKILSSGITETGGFPFIEMEFIEGPDLEELLKPPHPSIFTIHETVRVASQLSNALAHCHKVEVKHGDIKSNNVKLNVHTGNYVLLDFGLAMMSDEQRRTSLRHAGAIEFMAPEQNEGQLLFETDIYGFGVIIYELLAGQVPFPLRDNSEAARNEVRMDHMDTAVPDLLASRQQHLPPEWPADQKKREMQVPSWLLHMVYQCLEKDPTDRFANGADLHQYIVQNSLATANVESESTALVAELKEREEQLLGENSRLHQALQHHQQSLAQMQTTLEAERAKPKPMSASAGLADRMDTNKRNRAKAVSSRSVFSLLFVAVMVGGLAAYGFLKYTKGTDQTTRTAVTHHNMPPAKTRSSEHKPDKNTTPNVADNKDADAAKAQEVANQNKKRKAVLDSATAAIDRQDIDPPVNNDEKGATTDFGKYKVRSKAYFYNEPDKNTRRNAFIVHWNNAILQPLDETDDYVYIVFTNDEGQTSKGWLRKKDLIRVKE